MGDVRACVCFSMIILCFQIAVAKPFFGTIFWCDLFCDDDDNSATTVSSEDYFDDWCSDCPVRRPRVRTTMSPIPNRNPGMMPGQPLNFMIPPSNGMNVSLIPNNFGWGFNFVPWPAAPGSPSGPPPGAATATISSTFSAASTAAATTAAPTTAASAAPAA